MCNLFEYCMLLKVVSHYGSGVLSMLVMFIKKSLG